MDLSLIHQNITSRVAMDKAALDYFDTRVTVKQLERNQLLVRPGEPCKYLNYIHSGALRSYVIDKQGKEATVMFAVTDWWLTDMHSFLNEQPAMMYIEALQDSVIIQLSKTNLDEMLAGIPPFEKFFRILMQNAYTREQCRVIDRLTLSAEERYDAFLAKYPHFVRIVTQKQIASYLGITPEFLSAIRKTKTKKKS